MSARIIPIGVADGSRTAIASTLRQIAEDVERGRVTNVAVAVVINDGSIGTYHGAVSTQEAPWVLLGGLAWLKARVLRVIGD